MTSHAAIGIDDDLTACEARIALRTADDETASRIDEEFRLVVEQAFRQFRFDDEFEEVAFDLFAADFGAVLCRNDDRIDADRFAVFIFDSDLGLAIGTEIGQCAVFADFGQAACQAVCQGNRQRHVVVRFVGSIAEHHALVASADSIELIRIAFFLFQGIVDAHSDVRGLFVQGNEDAASVAVKTIFSAGIADVTNRFADDVRDIDVARRRNFTDDMYHTSRYQGFASNASVFIFCENGIQNAVRNLVSHFIGMAFGDGFGCKEFTIFCHE